MRPMKRAFAYDQTFWLNEMKYICSPLLRCSWAVSDVLCTVLVQVGEDGRVYAAVQYPSMSELWPDVYRTKAVRVVEVSSTSCACHRFRRLSCVSAEDTQVE